ncbi:flagellar hook-associated protein 2 [Nitrospira sp.]|nr:flagellar hook-associated protein 2 [Nitrospira sp.]
MATISFGGLGNGVDFGQVVDQLVKVQQLPIDALQSKKSNLQTKLTDYGTLGGKLVALQSATDALRLPSFFDRTAATVSDESVLGVSASSTATPGTYLVQVTRLATAHQIASKATKTVTATTSDIVSGAGATFSFRVGTSAIQTVTLSDTATLEDLRDQINDLGSGATASIVNTGTSATPAYRLLLTASSTGADRTITITADSTDLDFLNGSGAGGFDTLQLAQDATVVLGDPAQTQLTIQRDSNTITDAIPGVVLNLKQTTAVGQFATVTVSLDTAQVKDNIKKLVTAYNEVVNFITSHNTYDTATKQGGTFFAESTVRTVVSGLRRSLSDQLAGSSVYGTVGEIGFKTERDGTITLEDAKLDSALSENYSAVRALLANQGTASGVAQRVLQAVDKLDDLESGAVTTRKNGLTTQIDRLDTDIQRKEDALSAYEARLRAQYASLDGLLRQLQSQSDFLRSRVNAA